MEFGRLVREEYDSNCAICGNPTRFSHINPSGTHVPCCKNCHYSLKDHIEEEASHNEAEGSGSIKLGCYAVIAIVVIILLAFAKSSC